MESIYNFSYFLVNSFAFLLLIQQLFAKNIILKKLPISVFLGICSIIIFLSKLLIINYKYDLSMDESYNFASYLALSKTPDIYWRDIDVGSAGPMHVFIPYLFYKISVLPLNWQAFHLFSTIFYVLTFLIFSKMIFRLNLSIENKYLIVLFTTLCLSISLNLSVPIFESELFPVFFFVLSLYLYISDNFFFTGICMFLACISKLQISPIMASIFLILVLFTNIKSIYRVCLGGFFSVLLFLIIVKYFNVFDEMMYYFIERNMNYATNIPWYGNLELFLKDKTQYLNQTIFLIVILLSIIALLIAFNFSNFFSKKFIKFGFSALLLFIACLYSIFKSGRNYVHYFYLLHYPLLIIFTYCLYLSQINIVRLIYHKIIISCFSVFLVTVMFLTFNGKVFSNRTLEKDNFYITDQKISLIIKNDLASLKQKGNLRMFVWGTGGPIHVLTGIPQATPNNAIDYLVIASKNSREKYRKIVVEKLKINLPAYIIIKKNENYFYKMTNNKFAEVLPEIKTMIDTNYKLLLEENDFLIYKFWGKKAQNELDIESQKLIN